jgi:hypothetical protein
MRDHLILFQMPSSRPERQITAQNATAALDAASTSSRQDYHPHRTPTAAHQTPHVLDNTNLLLAPPTEAADDLSGVITPAPLCCGTAE